MGRGRRGKKGNNRADGPNRTYVKMIATFKCCSVRCNKTWESVHVWDRKDDGAYCESCDTLTNPMNLFDEDLELDYFECPCGESWQTIHEGEGICEDQCDCGATLSPKGSPEKRFGRHYFFKCKNKKCSERPAWEDFSLKAQKTQRCTKCGSRGDVMGLKKGKPFWVRRQEKKDRSTNDEDDFPDSPIKHNAEYCDMCQFVIRQRVGKSCRLFGKVRTKMEDGEEKYIVVS